MTTMPAPSAEASQHSAKLLEKLREEITAQGGYITFARFMDIVLYAAGLGYYSAGNQKFGRTGDYLTAPEISTLFAKCIARQCQEILSKLGSGDILEVGAGSGKLAAELLLELERLDSLPNRYFILNNPCKEYYLRTKCWMPCPRTAFTLMTI
jgi:SAM-dependent MidA family methyltransferase